MNIIMWILIGILFIGILLFLRKRLLIFSVEQKTASFLPNIGTHFTIGMQTYWIPQLEGLGIEKISLRKFKGCKKAVRFSSSRESIWYKMDGDLNIWLCRIKIFSCFWHIPSTIYYV